MAHPRCMRCGKNERAYRECDLAQCGPVIGPGLRFLVCGGRDYTDKRAVFGALDVLAQVAPIAVIIHGAARGADLLGDLWAREHGIPRAPYPIKSFEWDRYGHGAGPLRNQRMLDDSKPDGVVVFPGGNGTLDMMTRAVERLGEDKVWVPYEAPMVTKRRRRYG